MANITAREIAQRLGLSPAAVSLALNGKDGVSDATREKVLQAARDLGYTLPRLHHTINKPASRKICFVVYVDLQVNIAEQTALSAYALKGAEAAATRLGYQLFVRYLHASQPLAPQLPDILADADAIILLGTDIVPRSVPEVTAFVEAVHPLPLVILGNAMLADRVDCIVFDNYAGAKLAVEHLIEQGCTHIGYLRSKQRIESLDERERGLHAALAAHQLPIGPVVDVAISSSHAFFDFYAWLEHTSILPDAFFADHDGLAMAAIRALNMRKIHMPEQVAIIGFGDSPICDMSYPPLSSVSTPKELLGSCAISCICHRLLQNEIPYASSQSSRMQIRLSTQLQPRASSLRNK